MGEALFELEHILRSNQDGFSLKEAHFLQRCKSDAVKNFAVGALIGSGIAWTASWRMNSFVQLSLSGGAAALCGLWRFGRSLDSCVGHILSLDGTRMQKELATIIVRKYPNDPWTMQHMSKRFYSEKVFDDSTVDEPKLRWRYRNFSGDSVGQSQRTNDAEPDGDSHSNTNNDAAHKDSPHNDPDSSNNFESRRVPLMTGIDVGPDPLDWIFGAVAVRDEIKHQDESSTSPRTHSRSYKRSQRHKRRMHHQPA